MADALRFRTYLSPSLPLGLFEAVATAAGRRLGCRVELQSETRTSGPEYGTDPFADGDVDIAFVCTPAYLSLTEGGDRASELLPLALVFDDPRANGRPVYYSDVMVRRDHGAQSLADLAGATWAYNDECSLSGYWGMRKALHNAGLPSCHFGAELHAGSHHASIDAILDGRADVAAIDSNALRWLERTAPEATRGLRRIGHAGPQPIQPVMVRRDLDPRLRDGLCEVLRHDPQLRAALAPYGVTGWHAVSRADYTAEAARLSACLTVAA